jgi:hypothetical protein
MTVNTSSIDRTKRGTSMQHFGHLAPLGGLVAFVIGATPVVAQQAGALPETTACPEAIASIATC